MERAERMRTSSRIVLLATLALAIPALAGCADFDPDKLDELLHAVRNAREELIDLEEMSDEDLDRLHHEFQRLRAARGLPEIPRAR